jgi:hypothetical protein
MNNNEFTATGILLKVVLTTHSATQIPSIFPNLRIHKNTIFPQTTQI